jgi:hypothetical protein
MILLFALLQLIDLATTLVGFHLGMSEASPFVRLLIRQLGPISALVAAKLIAIGVACCCLWLGRRRALRLANVWYAAVCIWNTGLILTVLAA